VQRSVLEVIRALDPGVGAFKANQIQIPEVYDETAPLSENEHGVLFQYGIDEKQPTSANAEIPEGDRKNALASPLACNPLDQKSAKKQSLTAQPQNQQIIVEKIPDHIVHSIAHARVFVFFGIKALKRNSPWGLLSFSGATVLVEGENTQTAYYAKNRSFWKKNRPKWLLNRWALQ
jgi:hypothetical protein